MLPTWRLYLGQGIHEQRLHTEKNDQSGRTGTAVSSNLTPAYGFMLTVLSETWRYCKGRTAAGLRSGLDREAAATRGLCAISLSLGQASERGLPQVCALSNKDMTWPGALLNPRLGEEGWQWMLESASREYSIVPSDYGRGDISLRHYLIWREERAF